MLESISIQNFRNIDETVVMVNFAEGKAPIGHRHMTRMPFIQCGPGKSDRLCPVLALYGRNAGGKTSVLRAAGNLVSLVRNGFSPELYSPNRVTGKVGLPTAIVLTFRLNSASYSFSVSYDENGIVSESLTRDHQTVYRVESGALAVGNTKDHETAFRTNCIDAASGVIVRTFIGMFAQTTGTELSGVANYLANRFTLITSGETSPLEGIRELASTISGMTDTEALQSAAGEIAKCLGRLDAQVAGLRLECNEAGSPVGQSDWTLQTEHQTPSGAIVRIDISEESSGVRNLIGLTGHMLAALKTGKTLFVDDLDRSLQGLLVVQLVSMFKDRATNTGGAQLLFTTNCTELLDAGLLGGSEIGIASLRGSGGTQVRRLADFPGIHDCHDFRLSYLRGDFGGIPFPYA